MRCCDSQGPRRCASAKTSSSTTGSPWSRGDTPRRRKFRVGTVEAVFQRPAAPTGAIDAEEGDKVMSIVAWIVLGLVAGFIASKLVNKRGEGLILDIALGIVGALVGGWLGSLIGMSGVTGLNLYSIGVAVVGAVVFLVAYHLLRPPAL